MRLFLLLLYVCSVEVTAQPNPPPPNPQPPIPADVPVVSWTEPIDWTRCEKEAKCYAQGKCLQSSKDPVHPDYSKLKEFSDKVKDPLSNYEYMIGSNCDIGLQLIPITTEKVLIYMQANGEGFDLTHIGIYQDDTLIVGCEKGNDEEKVIVKEHPKLIGRSRPVLYFYSAFDGHKAVCAVTIDKFDKLTKEVFTVPPLSSARQTNLKFGGKSEVIVPYPKPTDFYEQSTTTKRVCDPALIEKAAPHDMYHKLPIKDPVRMAMDCENYNKDPDVAYKYNLLIIDGDGNEFDADKLVCHEKIFKVIKKGPPEELVSITNQADFAAYCKANITQRCIAPPCTGTECPQFKKATATESPKLHCTDGKFLIDNVYYNDTKAECKGDEIEPNEASFYFNLPKETRKATGTEKCFRTYDCEKNSNLVTTSEVTVTENKMYCQQSNLTMKVYSDGQTYNETEYMCNHTSGSWMNNGFSITPNSRVSCEPNGTVSQKQVDVAASLSDGAVIGICIGIVLAILIGVGVGAYCCYKHCLGRNFGQVVVENRIKKWRSMTPNKRMEMANDIFYNASLADRMSTTHIMNGLELVDQMLKTETEDPEIWAFAYPFLDRFHGASRTRGNRMTGLFSRYLYLQAKRIIDKHGWISPTPITKNQPQGYIRAVAIRLFSYCRFNAYTPEMTKFIGEGFEKLRYDAVAQYPHCGLLWSYLATCRCKAFEKRFYKDLEDIAQNKLNGKTMQIAEADRFPEFGDIGEQAAFAMGSTVFMMRENLCNSAAKTRGTMLAFVEGMLHSSQMDSGIAMRKGFCNSSGGLSKVLRLMEKEEEKDAFLNNAIRIMLCYGQSQDAKLFENIVLHPDVKVEKRKVMKEFKKTKPGERYLRFNGEQKRFESVLNIEELDILNFFAGEMDKRELKDHQGYHHRVNLNTAPVKKEPASSEASTNPATEIASFEIDPQTGLLNDASFFTVLTKDVPTIPRIRACVVSEEEHNRYRSMLAQLLSAETLDGKRLDFAPDDIMEITSKMKDIIKTEPMLIEDVPVGVTVVTDIHGQLHDLDRIFKGFSLDGKPGYECTKFLFLGDYVDRGDMSLEVVMTLFIIKILYPDQILLLRGNHEFAAVNYGGEKAEEFRFLEEMCQRYEGEEAVALYLTINDCFAYLSIAGIIGDTYFCAHGGISLGSFTRHEMRRLEKPYGGYYDCILNDLVWSDPAIDLKGVCYQRKRAAAFFFGEDEFIHAIENIGCEAMIRGHQVMFSGYEVIWNRMFCVFSATANIITDVDMSSGAVAVVDENLRIRCRLIKSDKPRYVADKTLRKPCEDSGSVSTRDSGDSEVQ